MTDHHPEGPTADSTDDHTGVGLNDDALPDRAGPGPAVLEPTTHDAPQTGDIVIDSALVELAAADPADLDEQLTAGQALHRTLQARLGDLGS